MRGVLYLSPIALVLGGCAPDQGDKDKGGTPLPLGFELATAEAATGMSQGTVVDLSVDELKTMLAKGNVHLIDVRTAEEVAEGAIEGAEHIAMDDFDPVRLDFSDGREVVLYCRSGRRSRIVGEKLAEHTGQPARHLGGGILAWNDAERDR